VTCDPVKIMSIVVKCPLCCP